MISTIFLNEIDISDCVEYLTAPLAVWSRQYAEARPFHQRICNHCAAGRFRVIPGQVSTVHYLQKHLCLLHLIFQNAFQSIFQKRHKFGCTRCLILCDLPCINQSHQKPSFRTKPHSRALTAQRISPFRFAGTVICVYIEPKLFIPQELMRTLELVNNVVPAILPGLCEASGIKGHPHIQSVQPDLIGIDILVPEVSGRSTRVIIQVAEGLVHRIGITGVARDII